MAKYIEQDPEKFIVSNLGVDLDRFSPGPKNEGLVKKYNISNDDFVLLFVGGLDKAHYFKGLDYLLRAVAMVGNTNIKLMVVGGGELKEGYQEKAKKLGIEKRVTFVGPVSNEDLPRYYRLCDVFVFPSIDKSEAYGLVALEAGACAKPSIASNLPGVRFVVKEGEMGVLVEPKDADQLAEKIKYLFNSKDLVKELGQKAHERVEREFKWSVIVEKIRGVYKSL
ncbi:glycosyltransferase family 4 protein [Candidatus Saccharibacteria bacterium]|nr:glycosyltransferase family 4 protein [Candidatus Saccharibacteria bacterium]